VLDFDVSEAVEGGLIISREHAKGIEKSKRRLDTKFVLEGRFQGGGRCLLRGRGEGGGAGKERCKDNSLHGFKFDFVMDTKLLGRL
jgi:hypothetical protein